MIKLDPRKTVFLSFVFCALTAIASRAQSFTSLASFDGANGYMPWSTTLIQATDGNFYGTTSQGGGSTNCDPYINGCGTVFKITPAGKLTMLHSFHNTDGVQPFAGLVQATDGNFYGTTSGGGANNFGTVFKITPAGRLTTLHSFDGTTDGAAPESGLVQPTDENFYGTTSGGWASNKHGGDCGTVFKITSAGTLTTLYGFDGTDGAIPHAGLVQATDGNFYGTTGADGNATVFKITPGGKVTTLYSFCPKAGCADGDSPYAGLVQATEGNFYGTTHNGGASTACQLGCGTVFKITPAGKLTTLHSFHNTDGVQPFTGLVQATDGNFYGTTSSGGANNFGTVFKITPAGTLTTLHSFDGTDGAYPNGGLVQATDGNFYGTTTLGGTGANCGLGGCGTVFSLSVGLDPFVKTEPTSGEAGAAIIILGTDLTGATSVTFNGVAAAFTAVSSSEIEATVPAGASSGKVEVSTPHGALSSNVPFRVAPKLRHTLRPPLRPRSTVGM
jgi:uncharacterized repeat protein (TIGR03803 family)